MAIKLLFIETSTDVCSVALSSGNKIIDEIFISEPKTQAKMTASLIHTLLERNSMKIGECDAVVVSEGPGSYTGLRVGVSVSKGICYGANIPLISVGSLQLLANMASAAIKSGKIALPQDKISKLLIIPMIDARRMEVYTAMFDSEARLIRKTEAMVIDESSFGEELALHNILFVGNGSQKVSEIIKSDNALFVGMELSASGMLPTAIEKYRAKIFEDTAYFEPAYLKNFVAGISKKSRLF